MNALWGPETRPLFLLASGALLLIGGALLTARILRSLRHGFSIRLQVFLAIVASNVLVMGVYGLLILDRLQGKAAEIAATRGPSVTSVLEGIIADFGPPLFLMTLVLGGAAAIAARQIGRAVGGPLEGLTRAAEAVASGSRKTAFPAPAGREVRQLTDALTHMRVALDERHAMERFVGDLSHELKNPVSAIRAACEVLAEGAAEDPKARDRFLGRIAEASVRLDALVQDLLALVRLEAHGIADEVTSLDLAQVIRQAVEGQAGRLEAKGIRAEVVAPDLSISGSARWIRRALDNLLINAIRFAPERSTITVTCIAEPTRARVTVADQGIGVAPAMKPRLFERFVTDRPDKGGTGLGLAIVQTVASQHGGAAWLVESGPDGATFALTLAR